MTTDSLLSAVSVTTCSVAVGWVLEVGVVIEIVLWSVMWLLCFSYLGSLVEQGAEDALAEQAEGAGED